MPVNGQPGVLFPAVARATDLPSAIVSVNQLKHIVDILINQFESAVHWVERARRVEIVRITNPQNQDNWVDVERIMEITFQNLVTGEIFKWNYLSPDAPHYAKTTSIETNPSPGATSYVLHRSSA